MRTLALFLVGMGIAACSASDGPSNEGAGGVAGSGATAGATGGSFPGGGSGGFAGASGSGTGATAGVAGADGGAGAPPDSGNCKTSCLGNECGLAMPDLCGGTLNCGDCGDITDYCIKLDPKHQNVAYNAMIDVEQKHPEYFDPNDRVGCCGWKVLDLLSYRSAVLEFLVGKGLVAIGDPNDNAEIRVRSTSETTAENVRIITSAGYSMAKYTSTCSPAGF